MKTRMRRLVPTKTQSDILRYVKSYRQTCDIGPSNSLIMAHVDAPNFAAVTQHLRAIKLSGWVDFTAAQPGSIRLTARGESVLGADREVVK